MIFILVWSTLAVLTSAVDEKVEDNLVASLSKALVDDTNRAAAELATSWVTDKVKDQASVDKVLDQVATKVVSQVKPVLINLVKSALGEAVKSPEKTAMFQTLHDIILSQAKVLTLGKAKLLKTNDAVNISDGKGTDAKLFKIFETLFNKMKTKDVKQADKDHLLEEAQINIDAVVNQTLSSAAKPKDTLASRSGNFFLNSHYQEQQQQHSRSLAQKLTHQVMTDVIRNPPCQLNHVHNPCGNPCSNPCSNPCPLSGVMSHGEVFQQQQGLYASSHQSSTGTLCGGGTGLGGSSLTNSFATGNVGQYASNSAYSGSNFGSNSAYSGSNYGSNSAYSGSNYGSNSAYSGSSFNSHLDSSLSSVSDSKSISSSGTIGSGVKGYYAGNANLWYLGDKPSDSASGSSFGRYGSSSLGSSLYGTDTLGGVNSNSMFNSQGGTSNFHSQGIAQQQHSVGTALNMGRNVASSYGSSIDSSLGSVGSVRHVINGGGGLVHGLGTGLGSDLNGVGNVLGGYGQQGSHFSVSNSQSSKSDSSHNQMSYSNTNHNNMW